MGSVTDELKRPEAVDAILNAITNPTPETVARLYNFTFTPAERHAGTNLGFAALEASHDVDGRMADARVFVASRIPRGQPWTHESIAATIAALDPSELEELKRLLGGVFE